MWRKLTYDQKLYRLKAERRKKEFELKYRLNIKYWDKADIEFVKRMKPISKRMDRKEHNLKVESWKMKGNAKIRVKKPTRTSEINKARDRHAKKYKIINSKKQWNKYVSDCYSHEITFGSVLNMVVVSYEWDTNSFKWHWVHAWHQVMKGNSNSLKFYGDVIRCQCPGCNKDYAHDQKAREWKREKEVWQVRYDKAILAKNTPFAWNIDEIREYWKECKTFVLAELEKLK